ncbi:MAG: alanine racemase [Oscillospiraceae bacterium]|nr:alanine racemase [Oscillospiraceae bacterium]
MRDLLKRTWAEINLDALHHNIAAFREIATHGTEIMAVVKADAYGHGFEKTVCEMLCSGADRFGVSNIEEALQIRRLGIKVPILVLGYTPPEKAAELAYNDVTQTVFDAGYGKKLAESAEKAGVVIKAHIKVDTGMGRLGFFYQDSGRDRETVSQIASVCALPSFYAEGIFTHFAKADEEGGETFTKCQFDLFSDITERLRAEGVSFKIRHCCNSAASLRFPEMHLDMVRPGIILYGLYPSACGERIKPFKPVLELKTVVSMLKNVPEGTPVSYGGAAVTDKGCVLATLPIGYADGYPRLLSNKADMLVNGKRCKILGRVCMDQTVIDTSGAKDVKDGGTVTVLGKEGDEIITAEELARKAGLINYEIACAISKRVPRAYIKNGKIEDVVDYIQEM